MKSFFIVLIATACLQVFAAQANPIEVVNLEKATDLPSWLIDDVEPVPEFVNWTVYSNRVSPVKNQQGCEGAGWAFATIGLIEGQLFKNSTRNVIPLSEQQLLDCDRNENFCGGGTVENAINYLVKAGGVNRETDYPYSSQDGYASDCKYDADLAFQTTNLFKGYKNLPMDDEEVLKKVVARYGPVTATMDISHHSFQYYWSGVYYEPACLSRGNSYPVLIVGYGTDEREGDYWLVKNNWGEDWGYKGYAKVARNRNNHCGIATNAVIAL